MVGWLLALVWGSGLGGVILSANASNSLCKLCQRSPELICHDVVRGGDDDTTFPHLSPAGSDAALDLCFNTSIVIRNQTKLTALDDTSLRAYPHLHTLVIVDSGLRSITPDAFTFNSELTEIDLQGNQLSEVPWMLFDSIPFARINLDRNPLSCTCTHKWIALSVGQAVGVGSLPTRRITSSCPKCLTCHDEAKGIQHLLIEYKFENCKMPAIEVDKQLVQVGSNETFQVRCRATHGQPQPILRWSIDTLVSDVTTSGNATDQTLIFKNVRVEDMGIITCTARNPVGRVTLDFKLIVDSAPKVVQLVFRQKFDSEIHYEIKGHPAPWHHWLLDGQPLALIDGDIEHTSTNPLKGFLTLKMAGVNRQGNYTLVVSNIHGTTNRTVAVSFNHVAPPFLPGQMSEAPVTDGPKADGFVTTVVLVTVLTILLTTILVSSIICWRRKIWTASDKTISTSGFNSRFLLSRWTAPLSGDPLNSGQLVLSELPEVIPLNAMTVNPHYDPSYMDAKDIMRSPPSLTLTNDYPLLSSDSISIIRQLGEGAFGTVHLATISDADGAGQQLVAVKVLKLAGDHQAQRDFELESKMMSTLTHSNIVHFYGSCVDVAPWKMVFEYMEYGDLNEFLRLRGPDADMLAARHDPSQLRNADVVDSDQIPDQLNLLHLLQIAKQISAGVNYLLSAHYVHRDLATRNCLVGRNLVVKIGDFGMSRDIYKSDYYRVGDHTLLPVRWMPPESILYRKFTDKSDVWSFGVVLWEIFSFGKQPWYGLSNQEVVQQVTAGRLLDCPPNCPSDAYQLMLRCWMVPNQRICMGEADQLLHQMCCPSIDPSALYLEVIL